MTQQVKNNNNNISRHHQQPRVPTIRVPQRTKVVVCVSSSATPNNDKPHPVNVMSNSAIKRHIQLAQTTGGAVYRSLVQKQSPKTIGTWLAAEVHKLGPTYVKLGQFISSRRDIFGAEFSSCFDGLRDQVIPIPPYQVARILDAHTELHRLVDVDLVPLASASIGQVHLARSRRTGVQLIVKIRRPNVTEIVEEDLGFLRMIAGLMVMMNMRDSDSTLRLLKDTRRSILREADFVAEANNIDRFYKMYNGMDLPTADMKVRIPFLVRSLSTPDILVMEYVSDDISIDTLSSSSQSLDEKQFTKLSPKLAARSIMDFFIRQLIDYGVIHGDPHKGNIGITNERELVLYDFGSIVTVTKEEQYAVKELVYMIITGNKEAIMELLEKLGVKILDRQATSLYIDKYIQYMRSLDIEVFRSLIKESIVSPDTDDDNDGTDRTPDAAGQGAAPALPVRLSNKVVRILKVYGILEGVCKELDPTFNYFDILDSYITGLVFDEDFLIHKSQKDIKALMSRFSAGQGPLS